MENCGHIRNTNAVALIARKPIDLGGSVSVQDAAITANRERKASFVVAYMLESLVKFIDQQTEPEWMRCLECAGVKADKEPSEESKAVMQDKIKKLIDVHKVIDSKWWRGTSRPWPLADKIKTKEEEKDGMFSQYKQ
jgi:hypothetical protein